MNNLEKMNGNYLNKYFSNEKHQPLNMGDTIIDFMIEDSINKIEAQKWKGLDGDLKNIALKDLLYRSDFWTERQEAAQWYGTDGKIAVGLIMIDNEWYISFFRPQKYTEVKRVLEDLMVQGVGTAKQTNGEQVPIWYRWRIASKGELNPNTGEKITGRIIRETMWYEVNGDVQIDETFIYPASVKRIPAMIIRNNAKMNPDWLRAGNILQEMNLLSNDIGIEWENTKTMWNNIGIMGKGKQAQKRQDEINNGKRYVEDFSANAKYAQQFQLLMSGSGSAATLVQIIAYLEDRALKYAFQGRESSASGANKHNAEISLWNQSHSEYLVKKKHQRENDFYMFFKDIVEPITGIKSPKKIEIESSAYEQGKEDAIKYMQSQRDLLAQQGKAQAAAAVKSKATADKDAASAKLTDEQRKQLKKTPAPATTETKDTE